MVHVALAVFLITIILLQHGKGADVGATFGGGGGSLFGAAGADNLLTKVTAFSACGFMITSILLAVAQKPSLLNSNSLFQGLPSSVQSTSQGVTPNAATNPAPGAASTTGTPDVKVVPAPASTNDAQPKSNSSAQTSAPQAKVVERTNSQATASQAATSEKVSTNVKTTPAQTSKAPLPQTRNSITTSASTETSKSEAFNAAAQRLKTKAQESSLAEKTANSVSSAASNTATTIKETVVEKVIPNSAPPK